MTTFKRTIAGTPVTFAVDGNIITATPENGATVTFDARGFANFPVTGGDGTARAKATLHHDKLQVRFGATGHFDKFDVNLNEVAQAA